MLFVVFFCFLLVFMADIVIFFDIFFCHKLWTRIARKGRNKSKHIANITRGLYGHTIAISKQAESSRRRVNKFFILPQRERER